ncbi:hypothetical protein I7I48_10246 [Histoplasma ohiense]|nr:hypothetical protein I7I48_10246 [Histoplasma ohiense (nom. inval.)]
MATSPQLPRHVSAHLSSLTSRPGVQSTLILSRKDGSIIRTTGLLATRSSPSPIRQAPDPAPAPAPASPPMPASIPDSTSPTSQTPDEQVTHPETTSTDERRAEAAQKQIQEQQEQLQPQPQAAPYKPSQAETLAAHIFAFVSSASALGASLSKPLPSESPSERSGGGGGNETDYGGSGIIVAAAGRRRDQQRTCEA